MCTDFLREYNRQYQALKITLGSNLRVTKKNVLGIKIFGARLAPPGPGQSLYQGNKILTLWECHLGEIIV